MAATRNHRKSSGYGASFSSWAFGDRGSTSPFILQLCDGFHKIRFRPSFFFHRTISYFSRQFGQFGWSGVLRGAGLVFFAYIGFDAVSTLAKDSVNPQKTLPKGILSSLAICAVAYIAVSLVLTGIVDYSRLGVADPMAVALNAMGPKFFWISFFIKIAINK